MSERPNPIVLAGQLRELATCWLELDSELTRMNGKASRDRGKSKPPLALDVLDAKRDIDTFTHTYVRMLIEQTTWTPAALNTPHLLEGLAMRIGHFTHNQDAMVAYEFTEDLETVSRKAWHVARPDGKAMIPIGPCFRDECAGKVRVLIDRDRPQDASSLALWRPIAVCDKDAEHRIDAKIYAAATRPGGAIGEDRSDGVA